MKNCAEWEQEILGELESAELHEHLQACERCREFADELEKNQAALGELRVPPAAFVAVRQRVLEEIQAKKRRTLWWIWPAAAAMAACVAILFVSYALPLFEKQAPPNAIVAEKNPPKIEWTPRPVHSASSGRYLAKARPAQNREPIVAVKMLTDDPNVIIIWLVDQKGDSL